MSKRTLVMAILDGWGIGRKDDSNPIHIAQPQNIDYIKHHYPAGTLQASGIAAGLPWGEEGNSEVGHLTLGAGRVLYQHYPRISLAVRDGSFFKNKVLLDALNHIEETGGNLNLVGLLTEGNVHASMEHLQALIKLADDEGLNRERLNLHLFTDGRDSAPQSAIGLIRKLGGVNPVRSQTPEASADAQVHPVRDDISNGTGRTSNGVKIASISGRFYAMDRERPDRAQAAYEAITGKIKQAPYVSAIEALETLYKRDYTDEYIEPLLLDPSGAVKEGDGVIFFNFREDRMRQLMNFFVDAPSTNTYICTFTKYSDKLNFPIAFPKDEVTNPLGKVLSVNGLTQLRIAETEKYAHITYFFNGLYEPPYKNEFRILIKSRNVSSYDEFPEMRALEITERALDAINEKVYDFILINYANPDMVAHTGNYDACLKAVKVVDDQIGKLLKQVLNANGIMLITSDHGNVERMLDPRTGLTETKHDPSPVPIYVAAKEYERTKDDFDVNKIERESIGVLADVAPTILELMGLPKPKEMTGISLIKQLR